MTYLYNPNGEQTVMHLADYNRLGAIVGALCGAREFSRSCNVPLGRQVCTRCNEVRHEIDAREADFDSLAPGAQMPIETEVTLLREALTRYGDRVRMATSSSPELQQVIDIAFEATAPTRLGSAGDKAVRA